MEVVTPLGESRALRRDEGDEVDRPSFHAQPGEAPGNLRPEAEPPQADDQAQPGEVPLDVLAVPVGLALGGWQDASLLVPTHRGRRHPRTSGKLRDPHAGTGFAYPRASRSWSANSAGRSLARIADATDSVS